MELITDIINLTPGQLLVEYWWLWLLIAVIGIGISEILDKKRKGDD